MPSTIYIPAQFMTLWSGNSDGYSSSAQILADTTSEPQRIVARFSGTTKNAISYSWLIPPGLTNYIGTYLSWIPNSSGTVKWEHRGAYHPTVWGVSHGGGFSNQLTTSPSVTPGNIYSTFYNELNLAGALTPMYFMAIELGRNCLDASDTVTGSVDLLSAAIEFDDSPGARNSYFWVPMNGVYPSIGTSAIGYYNQNGVWYRDFTSTDTAVDFQITAPSDYFSDPALYIRFNDLTSEPAGASGYVEIYSSIANPCIDYDQEFTLIGTGSLRAENGTGSPTTWVRLALNTDIQAGDQVTFRIKRAGDNVKDTFSGTYRILGMYLRYEKSSYIQSEVISLTNVLGTAENALVPTIDSSSYHWVGRYLPSVTTYLDLPIFRISPSYIGTPIIKVRWMTRDNSVGRIKLQVSIGSVSSGNQFSFSETESKTVTVRGDWLVHETSFTLSTFSPLSRDNYNIRLTRDGSDISDTFYGTIEVLDVLFDYVAS